MMGLAGVAFLTSDWMQFYLALGIPQILCLPLYLLVEQTQNLQCMLKCVAIIYLFIIAIISFLPESPQWLLLNKRMKTLEGYQNRSPEDKHYLDLVRRKVVL